MNVETMIQLVVVWIKENPDFLENFNGMIDEYRQTAIKAGIEDPVKELPISAKFFEQVLDLVVKGDLLNG